MRNVLDNSKTSHITLEKELQTLELYLQLESLRFEEHFEFSVKIDEKIDAIYTKIPSMLIQPYVENAIWHGLMHKKGKGKIKVEISLLNEKQLKCLIEDDGIGREKAKEYRSINKISYKSYGMMLAKERLNVLNKINDSSLSIEITDLKDENLNPIGTRVEIFVPIN
jgi:LytS/YehU family sensor histidine kinase